MSAEADYLRAERDNVLQTLRLVDDLVGKQSRSQYETIALGKLLQDVYTGIERILRTQLHDRQVDLAKSENWHKELLMAARNQSVVTEEEFDAFRKLLLFRHVQVHGYGFMLEEQRLIEIGQSVAGICRAFLQRLA